MSPRSFVWTAHASWQSTRTGRSVAVRAVQIVDEVPALHLLTVRERAADPVADPQLPRLRGLPLHHLAGGGRVQPGASLGRRGPVLLRRGSVELVVGGLDQRV